MTYTVIHEKLYFEQREATFEARLKDLLAEYQAEDPADRNPHWLQDHFRRYGTFLEDEDRALALPYRYRLLPVAVIDEETRMGDTALVVHRFATPKQAGQWMIENLDAEKLDRGGYGLDVTEPRYHNADDPSRLCGICGSSDLNGTHRARELGGQLDHEWDPDAKRETPAKKKTTSQASRELVKKKTTSKPIKDPTPEEGK